MASRIEWAMRGERLGKSERGKGDGTKRDTRKHMAEMAGFVLFCLT